MPVLDEDPTHFSKSRLKSDLVAHNVKLPPAKSKKEVYVELHLKHIDQKKGVEFSSDEEEEEQECVEGEDVQNCGDAEMPDPSTLTDNDLKAALLKHGFKSGPIVASTRVLYEKKLRKLLQSDGHHDQLNGEKKGSLYSDSEDEEDNEEDDDAESGAVEEQQETDEEAQEESGQEPKKDDFKHLYPAETTPTGIYATRRRPIKGAAGRPVRYLYPDTPVSPTTLQRREVERRLVPIHIQLLVWVIILCILYLIYTCVDDNTLSLLDNLNHGSNSEDRPLYKTEGQETPALSEWE